MNDYISREAAVKALENQGKENQKWVGLPETINLCTDFSQAINVINAIPPADVRPVVHGVWIVRQRHEHYPSGKPYQELVCPFCKKTDHNGDGGFCGYCGADMRQAAAGIDR